MAADVDPAAVTFVRYMDRSRDFYAAQGYDRPYRWAQHDDAPFRPLDRPLAECRVGVVTTTSLHREDDGDAPGASGRAFAQAATPHPSRMFTEHLEWDRDATHTDDVETFLPLRRLEEAVAAGTIGSVAERFYGVPTLYSHRRTARNAELVEGWCREDGVDVVLLIPL
ncbi:MAG: hypothetical protein AAGA17_05700 [Actinomycetota bacterium]|mgnify:CR=1 FL=1